MTDIEIEEYLFRNAWSWTLKQPDRARAILKRYGPEPEGPRKWFQEHFPKPLPQELEWIKKISWDMKGLKGEEEAQVLHPHHLITLKEHMEHSSSRRSRILVLFECSNKKPYNSSATTRQYLRLLEHEGMCDFAAAAHGIVPYLFSPLYSNRYNEWNHLGETPYGAWIYQEVSKINALLFLKAWKYDRVIVVVQHGGARRFLEQLQGVLPEGKLDIVITEDFVSEMKQKYSLILPRGMVISRMMNLTETKILVFQRVLQAVKDLYPQREDWKGYLEEILDILRKCEKEGLRPASYILRRGFGRKKADVEWPCEELIRQELSRKPTPLPHNILRHGVQRKDIRKSLHLLTKSLHGSLPMENERILKHGGKDWRPDLLGKEELERKFQWAWPLGKLLYGIFPEGFWLENPEMFHGSYLRLKDIMTKEVSSSDSPWRNLPDKPWFFWFKPITDSLGWTEGDVREYARKIGFIQ